MIDARPLIGLTGRVATGSEINGLPRSFAALPVDLYVAAYATAVFAAGGLPVHLPQDIAVAAYAGRLDGVLLSGGADLEPSRYGAERGPEVSATEPERDAMEFELLDLAVAEELPVLGICRGFQLLNVHGGGTLHQHVPTHAHFDDAPGAEVDEVAVVAGSRVHGFYGDTVPVNSLHHQTVDRLASGWQATGRGRDGTIEAIELPGHDMIGVQWHPELLDGATCDPVFAWLVDAARRRMERAEAT